MSSQENIQNVVTENEVKPEEVNMVVEEKKDEKKEAENKVEEKKDLETKVEEKKDENKEAENKVEEKKEKTSSKLDLVKLLINLINSEENINELKSKLSFNLDKRMIEVIKLLLDKSPDALKEVSKSITDIMADGVLNSEDIPKIVLLVSKLNKTNVKELFAINKYKLEDLINFIKFIVHFIISLDEIKVENKEKVLEVLDVSLLLLETTLEIPQVAEIFTGCCGFFKKTK